MIHFAQNNDIIIGVDFGYGNDIAVKTTAKVHEDGRLEILSSERIGRTRDYEHSIMVTRVWLNGKETKELVDTIQQWLDNNQDFIK